MLLVGVVFALLIGISLGLLGGGGSILTVPILLYVFQLPPRVAIATSLLVVGSTSAAALIPHARAGRVRWKTGAIFGAASMAGAYAAGRVAKFIPASALLLFGAMMLVTAGAVVAAAIVGSVIGGRLVSLIPADRLRKGFAWFVVVMAVFILGQEVPKLFGLTVTVATHWPWLLAAMAAPPLLAALVAAVPRQPHPV